MPAVVAVVDSADAIDSVDSAELIILDSTDTIDSIDSTDFIDEGDEICGIGENSMTPFLYAVLPCFAQDASCDFFGVSLDFNSPCQS